MMNSYLHDRMFTFESEGLPSNALQVYSIEGREQINQLFYFDVTLISTLPRLDLQERVGKPATLTLTGRAQNGGQYMRKIHGRIEHFIQQLGGKRYSQYQTRLSPTLFPLAYTRNSRIFRDLTTPAIVEKVLTDGLFPKDQIKMFLHEQYACRDFCVQYQESDVAFISRIMEEEGIFFFFDHQDSRDQLILGDGPHSFENAPHAGQLAYRDHPHQYEEVIHGLQSVVRFRPGSTVLRDFRFKHPSLDMEACEAAEDFTNYRRYYFPGEYVEPSLGKRLARIRHEAIQGERSQISAESNCPALLPGFTFQLADSWRQDLDRDYLLLAVQHKGIQPQTLGEEHKDISEPHYKNSIICMPAAVPYRPACITPRPSIHGVQTAVVVGPPGEEIHCDEHGRVKVQFHWDRQGRQDDASSCWIRVSQPWGGAGYGGIFIPRIGHEVLVQFLEGDPDRPVIIGRVYNGSNPVPYGLPDNKSISSIRTASTPGGGGSNEIRFNDSFNNEELFIHAQKDQNEVVEHDRNRTVGNNEVVQISGSQTMHIGKSQRSFVQLNDTKIVGVDLSINVNHDHSLTVNNLSTTAAQTVMVQASHRLRLECNGGYILIDEKGEIHIEAPKVYINCSAENIEQHDEQVRAVDHSGQPLAGVPYFVEVEDGRTYAGTTGADGKLPRIRTETAGNYVVYWYDEALAKMQQGEA